MDVVFIRLLNLSITASWLVLAVVLVRFLLKKAPKWMTCGLWALVGLRLLLPFSIESVWSLVPSAETVSPEIVYAQAPAIASGIPAVNAVVNPVLTQSFAPDPVASANPLQIVTEVATIVWLVGMGVMLLYALISTLRLRQKMATAVLLRENIRQSEYAASPFVLGVFRPRIYLPFGLGEQETSYVIAHEQAHIRRHDHWWKPLGFLLLSVYWFNPVLWLAYVLLCRDIEVACDEKVVREFNKTQRADYSAALLSCSISRHAISACPLAFGEVGVKNRVKNVLNYKKPAFWVILLAVLATVAVAVCFLTNPKKMLSDSELKSEAWPLAQSCAMVNHVQIRENDAEITKSDDGTWIKVQYPLERTEEYIQVDFTIKDDSVYSASTDLIRTADVQEYLQEQEAIANALQQLTDSVVQTSTDVSFTVPKDYPNAENWAIYVAGRAIEEDGFSHSLHYFEDESQMHTWTAGKTYSIPLSNLTELTMSATLTDAGGKLHTIDISLYQTQATEEQEPADALTTTDQGVTLTITNITSDNHCMYVDYEITLPEAVPEGTSLFWAEHHTRVSNSEGEPLYGGGSWGTEITQTAGNTAKGRYDMQVLQPLLDANNQFWMMLSQLCYEEDGAQITLYPGSFELSWTLEPTYQTQTYLIGKPIEGTDLTLDSIDLSPLSVWVTVSGKQTNAGMPSIKFKDGTLYDWVGPNLSAITSPIIDEETGAVIGGIGGYAFDQPLDLSQIQSISLGGNEVLRLDAALDYDQPWRSAVKKSGWPEEDMHYNHIIFGSTRDWIVSRMGEEPNAASVNGAIERLSYQVNGAEDYQVEFVLNSGALSALTVSGGNQLICDDYSNGEQNLSGIIQAFGAPDQVKEEDGTTILWYQSPIDEAHWMWFEIQNEEVTYRSGLYSGDTVPETLQTILS